MKLDLRDRCAYCRKISRSKLAKESFNRYHPCCSYHCQEMYVMKLNILCVKSLRAGPTVEDER